MKQPAKKSTKKKVLMRARKGKKKILDCDMHKKIYTTSKKYQIKDIPEDVKGDKQVTR